MRKMAAQIVALEREKAQLRDALEKTGGVFPNRAHVAPDSSSLMMDLSNTLRESERVGGFEDEDTDVDISVARKSTKKASSYSGGVNARLDALLASERVVSSAFKSDEDIDISHAKHHQLSMVEKRTLEKEVRRLVNERSDLMRTGAYSSNDRAITLIDERIEELSVQISA
jgi:centrosomal protein CEP120